MNAVVPIRAHAVTNYTAAQLALIKRTVAKDTSPDEFDLFMSVAHMKSLDPFSKQISALVFNKDDATRRSMAIITTIDGMRAIAARSGRYRPDEDEPEYTYDENEKSPANPKGIIKAVVRIYIADAMAVGGWKRATGVAYWEEFAPIKEEVEGGFDWVETGQFWPDSNKPKMRKVPRVAGAAVIPQLDTSGNWAKMPRVMLAKCAEAQVLRKAFPEDLSGIYEGAELDRARIIDVTASEIIGAHEEENRLARIGASNAIMMQLTATSPLEPVPLGQIADRVLSLAGDWDVNQLRWFMDANVHPRREFWARAKSDALELNRALEQLLSEKLAQAEGTA